MTFFVIRTYDGKALIQTVTRIEKNILNFLMTDLDLALSTGKVCEVTV